MASSKKLLAIFGATGNQGGSVLDLVLSDPALSAIYQPLALTRDPTSSAANSLQARGIEVRRADADDPATLATALAGVSTVFAVTTTIYDAHTHDRELAQGRNITDASYAAGVSFLIFSSLPSPGAVSGGKYRRVRSFEAKAAVETYIRSFAAVGMQSAFFLPGSFMTNLNISMAPRPSHSGDGSYAIYGCHPGDAQMPWIDIAQDTARFVRPLLLDPAAHAGATVCASGDLVSMAKVADIIAEVTGKRVSYVRLPVKTFGGFMPEHQSTDIVEMVSYFGEFGYYGLGETAKVEKAKALCAEPPRLLEDWIRKELKLQ